MSKDKRQRRKFDKEFKIEAVRLVTEEGRTEEGRTVSEVARNLGIHENLLHRWKRLYLEDEKYAFPGKGYLKPHDEELRRLKRELADVK